MRRAHIPLKAVGEDFEKFLQRVDDVMLRVLAGYVADPAHQVLRYDLGFPEQPFLLSGRMWRVSRGHWWGLAITATATSAGFNSFQIKVDGYVPWIQRCLERSERLVPQVKSAGARLVVMHIAAPILMIPAFFILPLLLLYRAGKIWFWPAEAKTMRHIQAEWHIVRAAFPGGLPMEGRPSTTVWYALATAGVSGALYLCIRLYNHPHYEEWQTMLGFAIALLGLGALVLIIATVLAILGFDD